jgi:hypothetical protein
VISDYQKCQGQLFCRFALLLKYSTYSAETI